MELTSRNVILFNAAAGALILGGIFAMAQSILAPEETKPCAARYHTATLFGVTDEDGLPASPVDMQSRLGASEWGVAEFLEIERASKPPQNMVMRVALPKGSLGPGKAGELTGGMGFRWHPGLLDNASSACLSYGIKLPADFQFNRGGKLPGLYGGPQSAGSDISDSDASPDRFSANFKWGRLGAGAISLANADSANGDDKVVGKGSFTLDRGRWVELEQEIVLNSPGKKDGKLRVWIDGELAVDRDDMLFRKSETGRITGVAADTHYAGKRRSAGAPRDGWILMTPFVLAWQ